MLQACQRLPWGRLALGLAMGTGWSLALGGCSGTPFGDQLSRSFSNAAPAAAGSQARPAAGTAAAGSRTIGPSATPATPPATTTTPPAATTADRNAAAGAQANPPARPATAATPLQPAPYRVTIKLPAADPSAPAEVVTQALRAAGVSFEVEMIERVPGTAATAKPATAAAPPTATPAPPPR